MRSVCGGIFEDYFTANLQRVAAAAAKADSSLV